MLGGYQKSKNRHQRLSGWFLEFIIVRFSKTKELVFWYTNMPLSNILKNQITMFTTASSLHWNHQFFLLQGFWNNRNQWSWNLSYISFSKNRRVLTILTMYPPNTWWCVLTSQLWPQCHKCFTNASSLMSWAPGAMGLCSSGLIWVTGMLLYNILWRSSRIVSASRGGGCDCKYGGVAEGSRVNFALWSARTKPKIEAFFLQKSY